MCTLEHAGYYGPFLDMLGVGAPDEEGKPKEQKNTVANDAAEQ